jgi:hypothetical protein
MWSFWPQPSCQVPNSPRIHRHVTFKTNEESNHYALFFFNAHYHLEKENREVQLLCHSHA